MASTSSTNYWQTLRDGLTGLAVDVARAKLVDVESPYDDAYIRDQADLRYGGLLGGGAGSSVLPMVLIGVVLVGGVLLLRKAIR